MLGFTKACLDCGADTTNESRCDTHQAEKDAARKAAHERTRTRPTAHERGLDGAWKRLSLKARRMQPWCSDCGSTDPATLTTDHLPSAWAAKAARRFITIEMVDVVCGPCNTRRGSSRPGTPRYEAWLNEQVPA